MTVRITEAELERNLHEVLGRVREGAEIIVEEADHSDLAIIRKPAPLVGRDIREAIAIAKTIEARPGYIRLSDPTFADDIEDGMKASRLEPVRDVWED